MATDEKEPAPQKAGSHQISTDEPQPNLTFGFDVLDTLDTLNLQELLELQARLVVNVANGDPVEWGDGAFGFDVVDVINDRQSDLATLCPGCNERWLMGPEALAAGLCWSCRTNGGAP
jgi:hypothetical protein